MREQLIESLFAEALENVEEVEVETDTFDYSDALERWLHWGCLDLLTELYIAASYAFKIDNELALKRPDFDKLCDYLADNFNFIPLTHRNYVVKKQLDENRCDLTLVEEGSKPKLGSNFPLFSKAIVKRLDEISMIQGSHSICSDS